MPESGRPWFFERNTGAEHNPDNPSRSFEAVTETYVFV